MDRSSRFQNPVPLSSGGFSKPPPIQNDGVGIKPLPPLLLDRFRAMVKEREEEFRVFGGAAVLPLGTDAIVRLYEIVLSELTMNSKPIITDLTIIAGEQRAHAEGIAGAICTRILEVSVDQKLPSLYLLDSIVKNIGKEYIKFFATRLPEVFCEAYAQVNPNMHAAMRHLFGTWSTVFPLSVLQKIETQLQFSPPVNGQSSGLSSARASESPRPTHGIHINPKYLEAQRQFGHSTVDPFGTEGVSSTGRAGLTTSGVEAVKKSLPSAARITRSSPPYGLGPAGSLSPSGPSLEDFGMDSSTKRVVVRQSPSRPGIDYGPSKVMSREEDTSEWRKRNWQGNPKPQLKASAAHKFSGGIDLRGPRALISAYGMDDREKHLNHKHNKAEELDSNGAEQKIAIRTWQNTEEEEFDWEDMTPSLADRKQSNDTYSSLPPSGNLTGIQSIITNHAARLSGHGSINNVAGVLPNVAGPSDLTSYIPPSFARESLTFPPQQSQSQFNAKGGGSLAENRSFLTGGEQKPRVIGQYQNIDGKTGGPAGVVSTFSSAYDSPAAEIRLGDSSALTKAWNPANFQNSQILTSHSTLPPQMQIRGQFGMRNASNIADQVHSEPGSSRSMSQVNLSQISSIRPGMVPVNLHSAAQQSLVQPNFLMAQEARQNIALPSSAPITSNTMVPPLNYGYLAHGQGPHNLIRGVQSSLPILNAPNMPFQVHGATLQHPPRGPLPGTTQALPIGQNIGQVAPNAPERSGLTGLISSLMAQGLISLTNQDSVGVEFDQDSLKVRHESAITSLYADLPRQCRTCGLRFKGQEEHSKHMDWHVNKNRTLKTRKTKPSPKWFVSVNMWLSGAEALGTEAAPGFLPVENAVEKEEDEELAVPADDNQKACALCGEPFDDFYSDEVEEWMYRGAVYMYAPGGSTVGMDRSQLGPIVHAKCRSDSHGISSEDHKKDGTAAALSITKMQLSFAFHVQDSADEGGGLLGVGRGRREIKDARTMWKETREREFGNLRPNLFSSRIFKSRVSSIQLSNSKEVVSSHRGSVNSLQVDLTEGRYLLAGASDATVAIYDVQRATDYEGRGLIAKHKSLLFINKQHEHGHKYAITSAIWYPIDTGLFVTGSYDHHINVWDTNTTQVVVNFKMPGKVYRNAMSSIARSHMLIAAGTEDVQVRLCDIASGAFAHTLSGHRDGVMSLEWSTSSEWVLVTGGCDGAIRFWDIRRAGCFRVLDQSHTQFGRRPPLLVCPTTNKKSTYQSSAKARPPQRKSANGNTLKPHAVGRVSSQMKSAKQRSHPGMLSSHDRATGHYGVVTGLKVTEDGMYLLSAGSDSRLRLWDIESGCNTLVNFETARLQSSKPLQMAVSQDSAVAFVPCMTTVKVFDIWSGQTKCAFRGHYENVNCCWYNALDQELYTGGNDRQILVWSPPKSISDEVDESKNGQAAASDQDNWSD
ncbi:Transducin/WD40 repeat-like superfamily protein [Perilla frutescens var. hirtella]|nr:Transducin/WD40 repeat-like superfamily protein [Perilla frutescens var. hirtella]